MKSSKIGLPALMILIAIGTNLPAQQGNGPGLVTVLDVAKVFENHSTFKANMAGLKQEVTEFQKSIREKVTLLTEKRQKLAQNFKIGTPEFKQAEIALATEESNLKTKTQQTERDYMNKEAQLYYNTYLEVQSVLESFAKQNNITLVLRFNSSPIDQTNRASVSAGVNRFIVYQNSLDITELITKQVNGGVAQAANPSGTENR